MKQKIKLTESQFKFLVIETIKKVILEQTGNYVDFNSFPQNVLKTLKDEYGHYYLHNFDWNTKQDEFINNSDGFTKWLKQNESDEFLKNLNLIIQKVREDLILLIKRRNIKKALDDFEELILDALGKDELILPLTEYLESVLLSSHDINEIERAFQETKSIINNDGSLNHAKMRPAKILTGDGINIANFERYVQKNPQYKGVYVDWKKLVDEDMRLTLMDLNAFRYPNHKALRELYDFLINFRKQRS